MASSPSHTVRQVPTASGEPRIQHGFDGDVRILNSTFEERMSIRKTLGELQQLLQRLEGHNVQIAAEIRLRVDGPVAKEHTYSVTVDDGKTDSKPFASKFASSRHDSSKSSASLSLANAEINGKGASYSQSGSRAREDDDDVYEVRPPKKARTDESTELASSSDTNALLREALSLLRQRKPDDTLEFVKRWHFEWIKQGGWLFDTLTTSDKLQRDNHTVNQARVGVV
ncbi:hypothetical protein LTR78_008718 [Recurvomyces mirabilis]|uniref:Uncharacterized protein n=1 Tax=Recurvomyces mirabilis TaxID=574656 RepID=A0AAE0TQW5_9PEZI|nr:hypothetical protein LTR78_008718 [Recurvomyces mirabilis]KAK5159197.1 hypothetical protein LTS14_002339 [Recurvomyces mirabilis]